ncbi:hypothetical protein FJZ27_05095 [Candidatus Peribacteria bacterium]|nr:hypothetical protein [Candidatus Peribacteria bacterium]
MFADVHADFVARVPEKVVATECEKLSANAEKLQKISDRLQNFS